MKQGGKLTGFFGQRREDETKRLTIEVLRTTDSISLMDLATHLGLNRYTISRYFNYKGKQVRREAAASRIYRGLHDLVNSGVLDALTQEYCGNPGWVMALTKGRKFPSTADYMGPAKEATPDSDPFRHINAFLYEINLMYEKKTKKLQEENKVLSAQNEVLLRKINENREARNLRDFFPWLKTQAENPET